MAQVTLWVAVVKLQTVTVHHNDGSSVVVPLAEKDQRLRPNLPGVEKLAPPPFPCSIKYGKTAARVTVDERYAPQITETVQPTPEDLAAVGGQ